MYYELKMSDFDQILVILDVILGVILVVILGVIFGVQKVFPASITFFVDIFGNVMF